MPKSSRGFSVTAITGASASAFFIIGLIVSTIFHTHYLQLGETLQQAGDEFQRALSESQNINTSLASLNESQCSDTVLNALRVELAQAWHILDIAYLDNDNMLCTAATGLFSQPTPFGQEPYNFIAGHDVKVYLERDARHPIYASLFQKPIVFRTTRFSFLLNPRKLWPTIPLPSDAEYIYLQAKDGRVIHIKGEAGLWQKAATQPWYFSRQGIYLQRCQTDGAFCLASLYTYGRILTENIELLILALFLSVLISSLTYHVITHRADAKRSIKYRVKHGLNKQSFYWLFQPIVSLSDQRIIGCEVLARFKDSLGELSPLEFIPEVKRQGKSWHFTRSMIQFVYTSLEQDPAFPTGFKVSLNLSPTDIENGCARELLQLPALINSRFQVALELTEDHYMEHAKARTLLQELADAGFAIYIDDFGTGYSNLAHLHAVPCHALKIDRTFVSDIDTDGIKSSLIPQIVQIGRNFGIEVIAEGIENSRQYQKLAEQGVTMGQGWLFGKPMSATALKAMLLQQDHQAPTEIGPCKTA